MCQIRMKAYFNVKYNEQWMHTKHVQNVFIWLLLVWEILETVSFYLIELVSFPVSTTKWSTDIDTSWYAIKTRPISERDLFIHSVETSIEISSL